MAKGHRIYAKDFYSPERHSPQELKIFKNGVEILVPEERITKEGAVDKRILRLFPEEGFTKQDAEKLESKGLELYVGGGDIEI